MQKTLILIILLIFMILIIKNMGNFIDITEKAKKSDIIVSLGGDEGCRLKKTLELYKDNISNSKKIIYTGSDSIITSFSKAGSRYDYFKNHGIKEKDIIHIKGATNTMEELFYLKNYMLKHHYNSVIFVSHPFHSRRIISLAKYIANYNQANIRVSVVSCDFNKWNKNNYYLNKQNFIATLSETIKLIYNLIKYSPLFINFTNYADKEKNGIPDKTINQLD